MTTLPPMRLLRIVLIALLMVFAIMSLVPEEGEDPAPMPSEGSTQPQPVAANH